MISLMKARLSSLARSYFQAKINRGPCGLKERLNRVEFRVNSSKSLRDNHIYIRELLVLQSL